MSLITTHILDTTKGRPAAGITIALYRHLNHEPGTNKWEEMARGVTNTDGRVPDLLNKDIVPANGVYKMRFETKDYFDRSGIDTFYPYIEIVFTVQSGQHYHIPLLLNPFGYSTYRGS